MSQNDHPSTNEAISDQEQPTQAPNPVPEPVDSSRATDDSTIGTGTSMAIGCIAGTILLIVFGLIFLLVSSLV